MCKQELFEEVRDMPSSNPVNINQNTLLHFFVSSGPEPDRIQTFKEAGANFYSKISKVIRSSIVFATMASPTQQYYPTRSREEYRQKYPNAGVLLDLEQKFIRLPGSKWGKEHLIACRLIQLAGGKILLILKDIAPEPNDLEDLEEWPNIKRLIEGVGNEDLRYKSRWELERENNNLGTLWSALAKSVAPLEANHTRKHPQRERQPTQREFCI